MATSVGILAMSRIAEMSRWCASCRLIESGEELHLLVDHRVLGHQLDELFLLLGVGQLAVQQQMAGLEEIGARRELLDGIASIQELALVAVDVRDRRAARRGRQEARVVRELARLAVQRADVDDFRPDGARQDRKVHGGRAVGEIEGCGAVGHAKLRVRYRMPAGDAPAGM
jgi:hypothetical protein